MSEGKTKDPFPAGTALLALTVWFVIARARPTRLPLIPAESLSQLAILTGTFGAVLACSTAFLWRIPALLEGPLPSRFLAGAQVFFAAGPAALVFFAMRGPASYGLQYTAIAQTAFFLILSLGVAIYRSPLAGRIALSFLLLGELCELFYPVASFLLPPDHTAISRLGTVGEASALLGGIAALVWTITAVTRSAGSARVLLFAPMPVGLAALAFAGTLQGSLRMVMSLARTTFGAHFDLALFLGGREMQARPALLLYLTVPMTVLASVLLSVAGVGRDGGAAQLRVYAWAAVLLAGAGLSRDVGPGDPVRLAIVMLFGLLFEEASRPENEAAFEAPVSSTETTQELPQETPAEEEPVSPTEAP